MQDKYAKILLLGLDNAGKTSLFTTINHIYGIEEKSANLRPTKNVDVQDIEYLSKLITIWDFGGQKKFREKYLRSPKYFDGTRAVLFLIDIQDEERFTESVHYLDDILGMLRQVDYDFSNPIFVCFSKSDWEFVDKDPLDFAQRKEMIINLCESSYSDVKFNYISTSIYDSFSIVSVFAKCINKYFDEYSQIDGLFSLFDESHPFLRAIIIDNAGLVILDYIPKKGKEKTLQKVISRNLNLQIQMLKQLSEGNVQFGSTTEEHDYYTAYHIRFGNTSSLGHYYISLYHLKDEKRINREDLNGLIEELKAILP